MANPMDADREAARAVVNTWGASSSKAELVEHLAVALAAAREAGAERMREAAVAVAKRVAYDVSWVASGVRMQTYQSRLAAAIRDEIHALPLSPPAPAGAQEPTDAQ